MNAVPASLARYRADLVSAIDRELDRPREAPLSNSFRFAVAAAVVIAATTTVLVLGNSASVSRADAAILRSVSSALTAPRGVILHERAVSTANGTSVSFELWQSADPPNDYRVVKGSSESASKGAITDFFDARSGTIVRSANSSRPAFSDPAASIKAMVDAGDARVAGASVIDGHGVWKLDAHSKSDRFLTGTLYVDRTTYRPVLLEVQNGYLCPNAACDSVRERIRFLTYEYLPATAANKRLLSVEDQHPGARIIPSDGAPPPSTEK